MKIMDVLVEELNKNETENKWERMHSEQYRIIQTGHGTFRVNPKRIVRESDIKTGK